MERIGLNYFRQRTEKYPPVVPMDEIHVLNEQESAVLRKVERGTVIRAAIAGALSAGLSGTVSLIALPLLGPDPDNYTFAESLDYWALVMSSTFVITTIEIFYLYYDALRSVHKLSAAAGLQLFPKGKEHDAVAQALVRAALELPNPPDAIDSINPRREVPKVVLFLGTLLYKAKATLTNFVFKAILRRVLGRAAGRVFMEYISMPVFAAWNAAITWWLIREARVRCLGPSAVKQYSMILLEKRKDTISEKGRIAVFRAIGSSIVKSVDMHPNLYELLMAAREELGDPGEIVLDNSSLFMEMLPELDKSEQDLALTMLYVAAIIDGKLKFRERQFIKKALTACGREPDLTKVRNLRKAFLQGKPIDSTMVESLI